MYSKQENQQLKQEFWIMFATEYPRKWILYDTKIKDLSFKFFVDNTKAQVIIDIEHRNEEKRIAYFEKFESFKNIISEDYIQNLIYNKNFTLESGKTISRIWVEQLNVSVSNRNYWNEIFAFFNEKMNALEMFYSEYEGVIKDV